MCMYMCVCSFDPFGMEMFFVHICVCLLQILKILFLYRYTTLLDTPFSHKLIETSKKIIPQAIKEQILETTKSTN